MSLSTSTNGIDANGDLFVYSRGGVSAIDKGYNIANGNYQQITAGSLATLAGVYQFANGSGALQVVEGGSLSYRVVTIAAGPASNPVTSGLPISTSVVGIDASGNPVIYAPPNATSVPVGSIVTYGAWIPLTEFETLPNTGLVIIEVAAGGSEVQAMNLVLIRPVTITPA